MSPIVILQSLLSRDALSRLAEEWFGDMVKAVVDCEREIIAVGGELHADEEQMLLENGSRQEDLWGINLYPGETGDAWIEFDSMINIRPAQGNRSRSVEDRRIQERIRAIVSRWIT